MKLKWDRPSLNPNEFRTQKVVGLPGFEPGSIEPKSTSLDQTSRQPLVLAVYPETGGRER
jgi:hypothetical protein